MARDRRSRCLYTFQTAAYVYEHSTKRIYDLSGVLEAVIQLVPAQSSKVLRCQRQEIEAEGEISTSTEQERKNVRTRKPKNRQCTSPAIGGLAAL